MSLNIPKCGCLRKYIDERLPEEYEKCLVGLNSIVKETWATLQQTQDRREKIQALSLAKDCYAMKLDLLTNATVVDDAIRFVASSPKVGSNRNRQSLVATTTAAAVKPKADTSLCSIGTEEDCDIQGSEEADMYQSGNSTTNSVF